MNIFWTYNGYHPSFTIWIGNISDIQIVIFTLACTHAIASAATPAAAALTMVASNWMSAADSSNMLCANIFWALLYIMISMALGWMYPSCCTLVSVHILWQTHLFHMWNIQGTDCCRNATINWVDSANTTNITSITHTGHRAAYFMGCPPARPIIPKRVPGKDAPRCSAQEIFTQLSVQGETTFQRGREHFQCNISGAQLCTFWLQTVEPWTIGPQGQTDPDE